MQGVILEFSKGEQRVINQSFGLAQKLRHRSRSFLLQLLCFGDAISQVFSVICGGMPGQTLAARAGQNKNRPLWNKVKKILDLLFSPKLRNHCDRAILRDAERAKAILSIRKPNYRI